MGAAALIIAIFFGIIIVTISFDAVFKNEKDNKEENNK